MKFTKTVLGNGLRVITVPIRDNPSVTVLVMVEAGSKYESKGNNGISHFLEHMVFKGTTRRPNANDISRELDGLGADSNAFTSNEFTGYYAKVDARHLDTALDIISDMYLDPLFQESEIAKEKGVIVEEIKMYKDLPRRQVADAYDLLLHGDQPAGWTVLGPEENIRSFTRNDFVEYRKKHYVASATTVVISGAINEAEVITKVEKAFATVLTGKKEGKVSVAERQASPQISVIHKKTDQTHIIIGLRTFSLFDKRVPVMRLLSAVLGAGMSSRLFFRMREELGICYYIGSSYSGYTDHGDLAISAGVDTSRIALAIENILIELKKMATDLVSDAELTKAKDYLAGTTMLNLETSDNQADFVAYQEILKKEVKLPEEIIAEMQKITAEEIRDLAREIFIDKNLNLAIIGPYENDEQFKKLLTFRK